VKLDVTDLHVMLLSTGKFRENMITFLTGKGKVKVRPRRGHEYAEGEKRYSSTLSLTTALDGGVWSTPRPGRFIPGKDPVPLV
jgi:hypothetical protein